MRPDQPRPRRTTAGSHRTWGGWEPRTCCRCGQKVTLSQAFSAHWNGGEPFTYHINCPEIGGDNGP